MPADQTVVRFGGLRELDRALGRANKDLRKVLRADLKEYADIVAREAVLIAQEKGMVRSGDMIRKIAPFALVRGVGVRSSSRHRGYAYPRRLEYEGRGGGSYGPHAVLLPAVDAKKAELWAMADALLERLMLDLSS